ncbi:MAG TPA: hypothetical protein VGR81_04530 [Candidatus Acidoferrales bacterium]|nr:hypothetical protein [Candidatus Acidoferrales bacterium]
MDAKRQLLRLTLATLAYRAGKALRGAPENFAEFRVSETTRTPGQILAHLCDLIDWGVSMATGKEEWHNSAPMPWAQGSERFFAALKKFDDCLASDSSPNAPVERLFQGPIADSLTHVGQIAMLRRLAGAPVRAENYSRAEITIGRVGADQASPKREFD